jgi:hypothetical protein
MSNLNYKPDKFGRAPRVGNVRIWYGRKRARAQERPLPFELQVRRQRAKRGPKLGGQVRFPSAGWYIHYLDAFDIENKTLRYGPRRVAANWRLDFEHDNGDTIIWGYFGDVNEALGWGQAASQCFVLAGQFRIRKGME